MGAQGDTGTQERICPTSSDRISLGGSRLRQIARQRASPFAGYGAQICDFSAPGSSMKENKLMKERFLISRKFLYEVPFAEERKIL
jgi:hypothetical protein